LSGGRSVSDSGYSGPSFEVIGNMHQKSQQQWSKEPYWEISKDRTSSKAEIKQEAFREHWERPIKKCLGSQWRELSPMHSIKEGAW
jgi:hypothetical protein